MEWLKSLIEKHTKDGKLDLEALNKEIATEFPKHAVPKETYNTLSETKKALEKDITERDRQLEELKKVDAAGLKAEIERLQGENEAAKAKAKEEIESLKFEHSLESALNKAGAKNVKATKALLDIESLKGSKNIDSDLETAITKLKESDNYLFGEAIPAGTGGSLGNGGKGGKKTITLEEFNKMSYKERSKLYSENPTLYKELTKQ